MTAKPLSAEEEKEWRAHDEMLVHTGHRKRRMWASLDVSRAETAAAVRERDALLTDRDLWKEQHDALRALAADLVEGLDALLDAGNPSASYCEECDSHAPIRADGEGLAGPLTHEPQCPVGTAHALLTRAAALGVKPRDGEKGEG